MLLGHRHPERDAAQELVAVIVVLQVGALHLTLYGDLSVVVLFGQQQLHGHQGLNVLRLQDRRRDTGMDRGKTRKTKTK